MREFLGFCVGMLVIVLVSAFSVEIGTALAGHTTLGYAIAIGIPHLLWIMFLIAAHVIP